MIRQLNINRITALVTPRAVKLASGLRAGEIELSSKCKPESFHGYPCRKCDLYDDLGSLVTTTRICPNDPDWQTDRAKKMLLH